MKEFKEQNIISLKQKAGIIPAFCFNEILMVILTFDAAIYKINPAIQHH